MKLYFSPGACSLAIRILLHELNINADYEAVNLKNKQTSSGGDFLKINPKGYVPALQLDNGEILTENTIIHQYLADKFKANTLLPPIGDEKRYHVLEWLAYINSELHKGCSPLFNSNYSDDTRNKILIPNLKNKLNFVDNHLKKNKYLMGDSYTLPDGYLFVILNWLPNFGLNISDWPHLQQYFKELEKRKSVKQALQEEKSLAAH